MVTDTARPPATNTQTHSQDRLQYTAPLASAQCHKHFTNYTRQNADSVKRNPLRTKTRTSEPKPGRTKTYVALHGFILTSQHQQDCFRKLSNYLCFTVLNFCWPHNEINVHCLALHNAFAARCERGVSTF